MKSIIDKVHHHYKISAAEVGENDSLTFAQIGLGMVSNDGQYADQILQKITLDIESHYPVDLVSMDHYEDY